MGRWPEMEGKANLLHKFRVTLNKWPGVAGTDRSSSGRLSEVAERQLPRAPRQKRQLGGLALRGAGSLPLSGSEVADPAFIQKARSPL